MKLQFQSAVLGALLLLAGAPIAHAQLPDEAALRNSSKRALQSLVINGEGLRSKNALSKAQAKRLLGLVRPWRAKARLTETEAAHLVTDFNAVLTAPQKAEVARLKSLEPEDGPPPGMMPSLSQIGAMMSLMNNFLPIYNPLYSGTYKQVDTLPAPIKKQFSSRTAAVRAALGRLARKAG